MTRGERVCAFIERYCIVPEAMLVGQPMRLAPFQRQFILDVYDNPAGTRRAYLSMARKNGKTGLIASLLLAHLVGPEALPNSRIISGAMSLEQAAEVYNYAEKMVQLSAAQDEEQGSRLCDLVSITPSKRKLTGLPRNVTYQAISADRKTAHGKSPALAILDEVGQVEGPRDPFIAAILTSQGAYKDPLLIAISTQAATDGDMFSIWLDDAAKSKPPRIVSHVHSAPKGCDVLDEAAWEAANPALDLFRSREDVRLLAEDAARMPSSESDFRHLYLNQRVSTVSPFVSQSVWDSCGATPAAIDPELPVVGGLDLSAHTDLTSLVLIQKQDGVWQVWPYFWAPEEGISDRSRKDRVPYEQWAREGFIQTTAGRTVDYEDVATEIADILHGLNVHAIAFDQWRMDILQKEFDRLGIDLPLEGFRQGFRSMSPALDALEADLLNERIAHGGNPVLTMCAANAVISKDPAGNRKLDKKKATGRIDGMVALTMARGVADRSPVEEPSVYETRGVLEIEV